MCQCTSQCCGNHKTLTVGVPILPVVEEVGVYTHTQRDIGLGLKKALMVIKKQEHLITGLEERNLAYQRDIKGRRRL